jgi:hypothetical protein
MGRERASFSRACASAWPISKTGVAVARVGLIDEGLLGRRKTHLTLTILTAAIRRIDTPTGGFRRRPRPARGWFFEPLRGEKQPGAGSCASRIRLLKSLSGSPPSPRRQRDDRGRAGSPAGCKLPPVPPAQSGAADCRGDAAAQRESPPRPVGGPWLRVPRRGGRALGRGRARVGVCASVSRRLHRCSGTRSNATREPSRFAPAAMRELDASTSRRAPAVGKPLTLPPARWGSRWVHIVTRSHSNNSRYSHKDSASRTDLVPSYHSNNSRYSHNGFAASGILRIT